MHKDHIQTTPNNFQVGNLGVYLFSINNNMSRTRTSKTMVNSTTFFKKTRIQNISYSSYIDTIYYNKELRSFQIKF